MFGWIELVILTFLADVVALISGVLINAFGEKWLTGGCAGTGFRVQLLRARLTGDQFGGGVGTSVSRGDI